MFRPMFNTADFLKQSSLSDFFRKSIFEDEDNQGNGYGSTQQSHPNSMSGGDDVRTGSAPASSYFNSLMMPDRPMNTRRPTSHHRPSQKPRMPQRYRKPQQATPPYNPMTTMRTTMTTSTTTMTTRLPQPSYNREGNKKNRPSSTSMSYQQMNMGMAPPRMTSAPASTTKSTLYYKPTKTGNRSPNMTPRPQSTAFVSDTSYGFGQKIPASQDAYGTPQSDPIMIQEVAEEPPSGNVLGGQYNKPNQAVNQINNMMSQDGNQNVKQMDQFSSPMGNGNHKPEGDQSDFKYENPFTKGTNNGLDKLDTSNKVSPSESETTGNRKYPSSPLPEMSSETLMPMAMMSTSTTSPTPPSQSPSYNQQRRPNSESLQPSPTSLPMTTSTTTTTTMMPTSTTIKPTLTPGPIYYKPMPTMEETISDTSANASAMRGDSSMPLMKAPTSESSDLPGKMSIVLGNSYDQRQSPSSNEVRYYRSYRSRSLPNRYRRRYRRSFLW